MSLNSVVMCVAASYRTLKRGAVNFRSTFFIYLSLLCQVLARILSFLMLYLYQRKFYPTIPVILAIHFIFVGVLKWFFERARLSKPGFLSNLVAFINIFASSFVYVRIVSIEKLETTKQWTVAPQITHTTFMTQSMFFLLILLENLLLALVPILLHDGEHCCIPLSALTSAITGIAVFCLLSWVFHTAYYKYYGHPWADINGPDITSSSMTVRYHYKGTEKACTLFCGISSVCGHGAQSRRGLCWIRNGSADEYEKESEFNESEIVDDIPVEVLTNSLKWRRKDVNSICTGTTEV